MTGDNTANDKPSDTNDDHISVIREEYYSRLMEFLPTVVYTCDTDGVITYYNKAAAAFWRI